MSDQAISLIKISLSNEFYKKNQNLFVDDFFPKPVDKIWNAIKFGHKKFGRDLNTQEILEIIKVQNGTITEAAYDACEEILFRVNELPSIGLDVAEDVLRAAYRQEVGRKIIEGSYGFIEHKDVDIDELDKLLKQARDNYLPEDNFNYVTTDVQGLLGEFNDVAGWRFNIEGLHRRIPNGIHGGEFTVLFARPEMGKCWKKGTLILLANGKVKAVEDIEIGDKLLGPDSTPRTVLSLCNGREDMYDIVYPWGEKYSVNKSHILSLKRSKAEGPHKTGDILNVSVEEYLKWPEGRKERYKGWKSGWNVSDNVPELDAYLFGVWLGDGASSGSKIYNQDTELLDAVNHVCELNNWRLKKLKAKFAYGIFDTYRVNRFLNLLRKFEVLNNKHIPYEYLISSRSSRLNLLAGLIDTDGSIDKNKRVYEITQKNLELAKGILYLARSLGFHSTITPRFNKCQTNETLNYRVMIYGPGLAEIPCRISRKKAISSTKTKRKGLHFSFKIVHTGIDDYYGFNIDKDHLHLLADGTVSHNSLTWISMACGPRGWCEQGARVHALCNEEYAKRNMLRAISAWTGRSADQIREDVPTSMREWSAIKDNIYMVDAQDWTINDVDNYCAKTSPDILVVDQLDKVRSRGNRDEPSHERLRNLYTNAREVCKRHNNALIGISQASVDAEGKDTVNYSMLEGSKTGKAAEADLMIGVGANSIVQQLGTELSLVRTLTLPKNKLSGDHGQVPCRIIPTISRIESMD